jgi:hypothetical protein
MPPMRRDGRRHFAAGDEGTTNLNSAIVPDHQDLVELDDLPRLSSDCLDPQGVARSNPVLFSTRLNYRIHPTAPRTRPKES